MGTAGASPERPFGRVRRALIALGLFGLAGNVAFTVAGQLRFLVGRGAGRLGQLAVQPADDVLARAWEWQPGFRLCRSIRKTVPPESPLAFDGFILNLPYLRYFLFPRAVYAAEHDPQGRDVWQLAATHGARAVVVAEARETFEARAPVPPGWVHAGEEPAMRVHMAPLHLYIKDAPAGWPPSTSPSP